MRALLSAALAGGLLLTGSSSSISLGRSFGGRLITAIEVGDPSSPRKALVIGCIHGNECAGLAVVRRLERAGAPGVDLWLVPDLNPDGRAADKRGNTRGVDLNRNFPWRWRRLRGTFFSGRAPSSERETRIAMRLILRLRPSVTIWFHQHLNMVVLTAGNLGLQRRFARLAGVRAGRLPNYPGTATGWQNARLPGTTAFVVELPAGSLSARAAGRYARAVRAVIRPRAARGS